jgi:hypothetical protein
MTVSIRRIKTGSVGAPRRRSASMEFFQSLGASARRERPWRLWIRKPQ